MDADSTRGVIVINPHTIVAVTIVAVAILVAIITIFVCELVYECLHGAVNNNTDR